MAALDTVTPWLGVQAECGWGRSSLGKGIADCFGHSNTLLTDEGRPLMNPRTVPGARPVSADTAITSSRRFEGLAQVLSQPVAVVVGAALEQAPYILNEIAAHQPVAQLVHNRSVHAPAPH
jgi:hypothetical protein